MEILSGYVKITYITYTEMFILNTKFNNVQKRTKKPKNHVQYEHIEHNVHSGHPVLVRVG